MSDIVSCRACPLRATDAFQPVSEEEITFIQSQKVGELLLDPGGTVLREGERAERLYTLLAGWAFRYKTLPDGRRQILSFLMPGDIVGLQAKLFEEAAHGIDALTTIRLCAFSRDRIWDVYRMQPSLAFDLTWLGANGERLVDEALLSVGRRTAAESMAVLVLYLWRRAKTLGMVRDGALAFPLTQAHIADALGLSQVHVSRVLQELRKRGAFELARGSLTRVNEALIARIARLEEPPAARVRPLF